MKQTKPLSQMSREEMRELARQHRVTGWGHDSVPELRARLAKAVPSLAVVEKEPPPKRVPVAVVPRDISEQPPLLTPPQPQTSRWAPCETIGWSRIDGVHLRAVPPETGGQWVATHPDQRKLRLGVMFLEQAQDRIDGIWPLTTGASSAL